MSRAWYPPPGPAVKGCDRARRTGCRHRTCRVRRTTWTTSDGDHPVDHTGLNPSHGDRQDAPTTVPALSSGFRSRTSSARSRRSTSYSLVSNWSAQKYGALTTLCSTGLATSASACAATRFCSPAFVQGFDPAVVAVDEPMSRGHITNREDVLSFEGDEGHSSRVGLADFLNALKNGRRFILSSVGAVVCSGSRRAGA